MGKRLPAPPPSEAGCSVRLHGSIDKKRGNGKV